MNLSEKSKVELQRRKERYKEEALLIQGVFASPNGQLVLKKLSEMCNENEPTFVDQNPTGSAHKEGQRSIIIRIRKMLNKSFEDKQERSKL